MQLAHALAESDHDTLRLLARRDFTGYDVRLERTFDEDVAWSRFARDFETDTLPGGRAAQLDDRASRTLLQSLGADASLRVLEDLLSSGRHQMVTLRVARRLGMQCALFVHSSTLGHNNGMHALRAGGFRRHDPDEPELDVFADGCNLARAMSYKNAAAGLPMGGCKMTVTSPPVGVDDLDRLGFLAFCIESGRILTGPDMGFAPAHVDAMREHFTRHCTGGQAGSMGPTAIPTALGVFLAIREAARHVYGTPDLRGRHVALLGVGAVGRPLAERLAGAGARLTIADVDPEAVRWAARVIGEVDVVDPDAILGVPCDVLAPCAGGGLLDEAAIDALKCRMIIGPANNPLKAFSQKEEIRLARRLHARGILFQPEWLHNTAGVMSGFEEYLRGREATQDHLRPRLERVCRDGTARVLEAARAQGVTPTEIAYAEIEARLFPGPSDVPNRHSTADLYAR